MTESLGYSFYDIDHIFEARVPVPKYFWAKLFVDQDRQKPDTIHPGWRQAGFHNQTAFCIGTVCQMRIIRIHRDAVTFCDDLLYMCMAAEDQVGAGIERRLSDLGLVFCDQPGHEVNTPMQRQDNSIGGLSRCPDVP